MAKDDAELSGRANAEPRQRVGVAHLERRLRKMLAKVLGLILGSVLGVWMLCFVASGFWTGRIRHTDSTSTYSLREHPFRFMLVAVIFTVLGCASLYFAARRGLELWHEH